MGSVSVDRYYASLNIYLAAFDDIHVVQFSGNGMRTSTTFDIF